MVPATQIKELFRYSPAFRNVFWADLCGQLGQNMLLMVLPTLILEVTHDVTLTGLAFTAEIVAYGLLSPFAGWIADRSEQRFLMLASNCFRFALLLSLLLIVRMDQPGALYLLASLGLGVVSTLFTPARAAYLRCLLQGERLLQAVALEGTVMFLARLVAPALTGLILFGANARLALLCNAGLYLVSNLYLLPVRAPQAAPDGQLAESPWRQLSQGWRLLLTTSGLRALLLLDVLISFVGMACWSTVVAFLETVLRVPGANIGWLQASMGLAGAFGTTLHSRLDARWRQPHWVLLGLLISYAMLAHAHSLAGLMAAWTLRGLVFGVLVVMIAQSLARQVPDAVVGRVQAAWEQSCCLACAAGSGATPWLLRHWGAQASFVAFFQAIGLITAAWWAYLWLRRRSETR